LMMFVDRVSAFGPKLTAIKETADIQAGVLADRERIQAKYDAAFATLSTKDRPPGKVAYETIDQIVRAGYNFRMDQPQTERRDQLTYFPINVNVFKSDFFKLAELFNTITARLPTVNLAELVISVPDKTNPLLLDARFKFVAIEINH
jgi:hypothetical protein